MSPILLLLVGVPPTPSSLRVKVWRRLRALGAVALKRSAYLLPDTPDRYEDFQWLAQEVQREGGDATLVRVQQIENMTDADILKLFHEPRDEDYRQLTARYRKLLPSLDKKSATTSARVQDELVRLAKEHQAEVRHQQIESGKLRRGRVGLSPIDIGDAGGLGARLRLGQHRPRDVQRRDAARGADGAREIQRGCSATAADVQHAFAGTRRGEGEQRRRHRRQRDVGVRLPRHPRVAARPVPEGELIGVDLLSVGHARSPRSSGDAAATLRV